MDGHMLYEICVLAEDAAHSGRDAGVQEENFWEALQQSVTFGDFTPEQADEILYAYHMQHLAENMGGMVMPATTELPKSA